MSDQDNDSSSTDSSTEVSSDSPTEASSDSSTEASTDSSTEASTDRTPRESTTRTTGKSTGDGRDIRGLLLRGTLLVLGVLAVVALFQFYTSALAVIDQWIAREYRALLRAAFNLAVLFATALGISLVVRELGDR